MENKIQLFNFENQSFRVLEIENEPWFVGKDVAEILKYKNTKDAIRKHVDQEDKRLILKSHFATLENIPNRGLTVINESGLYSLILSSKLPSAKKFKHKVTSEVLPSIRKHGVYMTPQKIEEVLTNPDSIIKIATELKKERQARIDAQKQLDVLSPKASYYDLVLQSKSLVNITIIAKDYGMSARTMNDLLHELKIQYRSSGTWILYSKYQNLGWTHSVTRYIQHADGSSQVVVSTKWTQKGRYGIYQLLKEKKNLLPLIEKEKSRT